MFPVPCRQVLRDAIIIQISKSHSASTRANDPQKQCVKKIGGMFIVHHSLCSQDVLGR